jgi:hypothetical protein
MKRWIHQEEKRSNSTNDESRIEDANNENLPLFIDVTELREAQKTSKRKLEEYQIAEEDEQP